MLIFIRVTTNINISVRSVMVDTKMKSNCLGAYKAK